jgi:transcription initiation factor TFIID subunit 15
MKQSFFVLLFTLFFALAAVATPQFFRGPRKGGRKTKAATTTTAANTIVGGAAAATTTTTAAGAAGAANATTASAAAAATTETGNNANFNSIALDGQPSGQACDISKFPPTNGQQLKAAGQNSCSNTQQGEIPDVNNMVSTVILSPQNGQTMKANTAFTVSVKTQGMNLGFFDDPNAQYYLFSQQLDKSGKIMGHQHVTIQQIGDPTQPLDPKAFAFFKGLNDIDNNGVLSVAVANGLPAGNYRLCTMTGAFGHQPVIMPVAQRGAQDDCIRFSCA